MNILVANERFLFRFGADRVLMIIARGLQAAGHRITMMANRYDRPFLEPFASQIIGVPADQCPYFDSNEFTAEWLKNTWQQHFTPETSPDVVLIGGWPFLKAIPVFREKDTAVAFIDFGVVPREGFGEGTRVTLEKLIRLRQENLSACSLVAGISDFIVRSQSIPETSGSVEVKTVLLGADHMEMGIWPAAESGATSQDRYGLNLLASLRKQGRPVILCLGRWETGCYKNSDSVFALMRLVRETQKDCAVLVLSEPAQMDIPPDLQTTVYPIHFPSDDGLTEIMRQVDLGVSASLWEGFNLPLAEMQWLGKHALVFNIGAHPEVVAHPWYLCRDTDDMARKVCQLLNGDEPEPQTLQAALERFRKNFTWDRVVREYDTIVRGLERPKPAAIQPRDRSDDRVHLIVDVTNSTKDPANSGVIRVTRRAGRTLQDFEQPLFVTWDFSGDRYVLPTAEEAGQLGQFNGPVVHRDRLSESYERRTGLDEVLAELGTHQPWLLCMEIPIEERFRQIRRYARARGLRIAVIFHDAIPVLRPDFCNSEMRDNHAAYMQGLAECDVVLPNSNYSSDCLLAFWKENGIRGCEVLTDLLPGEFAGTPRNLRAEISGDNEIRLLCVSTLEPRKNHRRLIEAFLRMQEKHPGLNWSLTLVGNRYAGSMDLAEWVEGVCRQNPRIRWLGIVDDATLDRLYREATFTVYASVIEGFGMPILESLWHGRPCLCADHGVMAELAAGGGCLTADVDDEDRLASAICRLATDRDLLLRLTREAVARPMKTWAEYAASILDILNDQQAPGGRSKMPPATKNLQVSEWREILYPNCIFDRWQMHESEKLMLTGLLARIQPQCSLEVGTYYGGSLSLISQFSKMTFSVDIDPSVPERLKNIRNVRFLTGSSAELVPALLAELDKAAIPVEFILIDGEHSTAGIMRDVEWLTRYVPMKPLFVALHDSFNPDCRRGMLDADWERSPYCQWVDLDFVPGRLIEHAGGGAGEMWGGLALAFFLPTPRTGPLALGRSAEGMFQAIKAMSSSAAAAV